MVGMDVSSVWTGVVARSLGKEGVTEAIPCKPEKVVWAILGEGSGVWAGVTANGVGA